MDVSLNLVAAVANAIGCPNWTCSGCDGDECYCRQAAEGVIRQMAELGVAKPIYHTADANEPSEVTVRRMRTEDWPERY